MRSRDNQVWQARAAIRTFLKCFPEIMRELHQELPCKLRPDIQSNMMRSGMHVTLHNDFVVFQHRYSSGSDTANGLDFFSA